MASRKNRDKTTNIRSPRTAKDNVKNKNKKSKDVPIVKLDNFDKPKPVKNDTAEKVRGPRSDDRPPKEKLESSSSKKEKSSPSKSDKSKDSKGTSPPKVKRDAVEKSNPKKPSKGTGSKVASKSESEKGTGHHIKPQFRAPLPAKEGLDPGDIDGHIGRYLLRIRWGEQPEVYKRRLEEFYAAKRARQEILDLEPDNTLSKNVKYRLWTLETMKKELKVQGDPYKALSNIRGIMAAYRAHQLEWKKGFVTYWSHGKRINEEPKKFDWSEFVELNEKYDGGKGFWVEGFDGPAPADQFLSHISPPDRGDVSGFRNHVEFLVGLRWKPKRPRVETRNINPDDPYNTPLINHWRDDFAEDPIGNPVDGSTHANTHVERFDFLYDTGSQYMTLYKADLDELSRQTSGAPTASNTENNAQSSADAIAAPPHPQMMGYTLVRNADGITSTKLLVMVTVNMRDNSPGLHNPDGDLPRIPFSPFLDNRTWWNRLMMPQWIPVACVINDGSIWHESGYLPRLSGPWPRHMFDTTTFADNQGILTISAPDENTLTDDEGNVMELFTFKPGRHGANSQAVSDTSTKRFE
ncbi:hypothetical protein N7456_012187 [Penicillium angulare]|uniref:Uncharacterized protein n=1 Tax=Penicillium angulare TaxID=116970 RepID=A0A9W9EVE0_9EURO|nr:hypothetical protein N7456_012187 [Penicillium angulare]